MRLAYIAGPYTAKTAWEIEQNVRRAEEWGLAVAKCGVMPLIPHTNSRFFHGLLTPEFWYLGTLELLKRSDAIILIPGWSLSTGARGEKKWAEENDLPIFDAESCLVVDDVLRQILRWTACPV